MYRTHLVSGLCAELQEQVGRATGQGGAPRFTIRCVFEPELGVLARGDAVAGAYSGATARRWTEDLSLKHGGGGGGPNLGGGTPITDRIGTLEPVCGACGGGRAEHNKAGFVIQRERETDTHTERETAYSH